ncbi:hypothetical protein AKO1_014781 [Acrasis kona]|uniref:JmjC domain-containing protein n=1 Tax=Acrasis kona TaxID=1008807 RepID=A0AAW2Z2E7_9EUKA
MLSHNTFPSNKRKRNTVFKKKKSDSRRAKPHPNNVKPPGNYYLDSFEDSFVDTRVTGMGRMLSLLDDQSISNIIECLPGRDLSTLSCVSKAFYIYCQEEDHWKRLCIKEFVGSFQFVKNWQRTYKTMKRPNLTFKTDHIEIRADFFYSEIMYHSWRCLSANLTQWCKKDNVDRREALSVQDFVKEYDMGNKPVVITDVVTQWPAFKDKLWTREQLVKDHGDTKFYINAGMHMKLKDFFTYSSQVNEENPAYLFDPKFGEECPKLLQDYQVPKYFEEDFFSCLEAERPNYRWFLAGPAKSGATFHKDPNHTSAWNACVTGHKKWVMYPPHITPPGVYPSADGLEVTAPISIVEWFQNFYEDDRGDDDDEDGANQDGQNKDAPIEFIQRPGDLVYVPTGWWHIVLNLEECIAVTHNFCNTHNIHNVSRFIRTKNSEKLIDKFSAAMNRHYPDVWKDVSDKEEKRQSENKSARVVFWEKLEQTHEDKPFVFDFGE